MKSSEVMTEEMCFQVSLENSQGSIIPGWGWEVHSVNENVLESDFASLCDGTMRRRLLADLRLLEGMYQLKIC